MVLVNQVVPNVLAGFISFDEFQTKDLGLTMYRSLEVDVLQASVIKDGVSLRRLPLTNKGSRKSNEPTTV